MAKLPRIFQKIFASSAPSSDIGVFGSLAAGSPATGTNLDTLQSLSQFTAGWKAAILGNNSPAIEDENALAFLLTSQLAYMFQSGVPEWDTSTSYYTGSFINYQGVLYRSLTDANTGNPPASSPTQWQIYDTAPSGIVYPYSGLTTPAGYALCDGGAESRTIQARLFSAMTLSVTGQNGISSNIISGLSSTANFQTGYFISGPNIPLGAYITSIDSGSQIHISVNTTGSNAAGTPFVVAPWGVGDGATTFNRPDLRGRTLIGVGAGAGLSVRLLAQKFGEEVHTLSGAEMPVHGHSITDPGHYHAFYSGHWGVQTGNFDSNWPINANLSGSNAATWPTSAMLAVATTTGITGTQTAGSSSPFNVVQPSAATNYIIKY